MTVDDLKRFRAILTDRQTNLADFLSAEAALSSAEFGQVRQLLSDIKEALGRIEHETYGQCVVCHDEVEMHRLEVQPALQVCLGCISDQERAVLEEELSIASRIHRALLPQEIEAIDGFDFAVKALAARSVGGDYYDVLRNESGTRIKIIIADTMGKGIPAGLVMSNLQGALRVLAEEIDSPSRLIRRLNHWICRNVPVTKFVSLACVDLAAGSNGATLLTNANAGHCPGLVLRADGQVECLNPTGAVLGVHEAFDYTETHSTLRSGELLAMYTDGVTEAENGNGEQYEVTRLTALLSSHHGEPLSQLANRLYDDVARFSGKTTPEDDFTVILLKKK